MKRDRRGTPRDQVLARVQELIRQHGWAVLGIGAGGCATPGCTTDHSRETAEPFYYTAGLTAAGLPELLLRGQPMRVAHPILNALARQSTATELVAGERYRLAAVGEAVVTVARLDLSTTLTVCKVAKVLYGSRLTPAWQVTLW